MADHPISPEFGQGLINKFGLNPDISSGTVPEDMWEGGGSYVWPAAAAVVTLASDSIEDDIDKGGAVPGTGAHTVQVQGLDANWNYQEETVTMNGTATVSSVNTFIRVFRLKAETVGTNEANVGTITAQISASTVAIITPDSGQTLMALYTVPGDFRVARIASWYGGYNNVDSSAAVIKLFAREQGFGWQVKMTNGVNGNGTGFTIPLLRGSLEMPARTDIRVTITATDGTSIEVYGGFELELLR
jgi:hypothetical protein